MVKRSHPRNPNQTTTEMINNNLNLSIFRVKINCQIRKFKITKLKQQVMPTFCHTDSTDVIENDYRNHKQYMVTSFKRLATLIEILNFLFTCT
jgi:hypothetical protein